MFIKKTTEIIRGFFEFGWDARIEEAELGF